MAEQMRELREQLGEAQRALKVSVPRHLSDRPAISGKIVELQASQHPLFK